MHEKLDKVFSLTRDSPVPAGLRILLQDSLKCKICHITPLQPPIIFAKCCKSILGYERCVDEWYADGGLSKNCPGCRGPRGLAETVRLHGLDDLVKGLHLVKNNRLITFKPAFLKATTETAQTGFSKSHYLNKRFP